MAPAWIAGRLGAPTVPTLARNWWATAPGAAPAKELVLALGHLLVENDLVLAHTVGLDLLLANLPIVASLHELGEGTRN